MSEETKPDGKKTEVLQVRFNLENQQDLMKWNYLTKKNNRQAYIKDLILIDMVYGVFSNPESLQKTHQTESEPLIGEEKTVDFDEYDVDSAIEF